MAAKGGEFVLSCQLRPVAAEEIFEGKCESLLVRSELELQGSCPRPLEEWWFRFPSEGKQPPLQSVIRDTCSQASGRTGTPPVFGSLAFTRPGSDVHRPAGMRVSFRQTDSVASSLFIHNCKQTESAVRVAPQLPSWLKTHLAHLLWIISPSPKSSSSFALISREEKYHLTLFLWPFLGFRKIVQPLLLWPLNLTSLSWFWC